jgi:hypothetical protein
MMHRINLAIQFALCSRWDDVSSWDLIVATLPRVGPVAVGTGIPLAYFVIRREMWRSGRNRNGNTFKRWKEHINAIYNFKRMNIEFDLNLTRWELNLKW